MFFRTRRCLEVEIAVDCTGRRNGEALGAKDGAWNHTHFVAANPSMTQK